MFLINKDSLVNDFTFCYICKWKNIMNKYARKIYYY